MTSKEIKEQCRLIRKSAKKICSSKQKARAFLKKLGFYQMKRDIKRNKK